MTSVLDRLMRRVTVDENGCWNWQGAKNSRGYGCIGVEGKTQLTHRVSYTINVGPIGEGLQIDHLCRNRVCANPAHMEPVSHDEHAKRSLRAQSQDCVNGHPLSGDNLRLRTRPNGQVHRGCRECDRQAKRAAPKLSLIHGAPSARGKVTPEIAEQIRETYAAGGSSQRAVAAEFGVSVTLVNFIVTGKRKYAA